jgi:hypothetical protein
MIATDQANRSVVRSRLISKHPRRRRHWQCRVREVRLVRDFGVPGNRMNSIELRCPRSRNIRDRRPARRCKASADGRTIALRALSVNKAVSGSDMLCWTIGILLSPSAADQPIKCRAVRPITVCKSRRNRSSFRSHAFPTRGNNHLISCQ